MNKLIAALSAAAVTLLVSAGDAAASTSPAQPQDSLCDPVPVLTHPRHPLRGVLPSRPCQPRHGPVRPRQHGARDPLHLHEPERALAREPGRRRRGRSAAPPSRTPTARRRSAGRHPGSTATTASARRSTIPTAPSATRTTRTSPGRPGATWSGRAATRSSPPSGRPSGPTRRPGPSTPTRRSSGDPSPSSSSRTDRPTPCTRASDLRWGRSHSGALRLPQRAKEDEARDGDARHQDTRSSGHCTANVPRTDDSAVSV
jgi:hypothetical protein